MKSTEKLLAMQEAGLLGMALEHGGWGSGPGNGGAPEVVGFELITFLGRGAAGEVWLADEAETGRMVALKILHQNGQAGASEELLQREIRILASLVHPNLVLFYRSFVTADGRQGLVMEWVDGWPLDEWLLRHPDLSLEKRLKLFRGIVSGTAFLHDHGVIHRDLKPGNVIVDAEGVAKIVDFGLARLRHEGTVAGRKADGVSGTLHFMAPEQAADAEGACAMPVDVYALGVLLHRLLTGEWLRSAAVSPEDTLALVKNPPPLVLEGTGSRIPRDLQAILRQALAADPALRYHHARELGADLDSFQARQPVAARKHTLSYLTITLLRRQARRSTVAAVLVLAGLVSGGLLYQRHRVVTVRNEANLRHAHTLTSFVLGQLREELRAITTDEERGFMKTGGKLPKVVDSGMPPLPVDAAGELDLRYYHALLADLRAATSEGHARYGVALKSIQPALDTYSQLALESPDDPERLLDAARARLDFARLLGRIGRMEAAGGEAGKALRQLDRLVAWPGFDPVLLPPLRQDAMLIIAREANHSGDPVEAVRIGREIVESCMTVAAEPSTIQWNEALSRLSVASSDLVTHAISAGPESLLAVSQDVDRAMEVCRSAYELEPRSFFSACCLARCLYAKARMTRKEKSDTDLRVVFEEIASLLVDTPSRNKLTSLPLVWEISRTVTDWAGEMNGHQDPAVARASLDIAKKLTSHLRSNGYGTEDLLIQRARICLYESRLACRSQSRQAGARPIYRALVLLRPRQLRDPDRMPLAFLTAAALHQARTLSDIPETRWSERQAKHLEKLLARLEEKHDELTPVQQAEFATFK